MSLIRRSAIASLYLLTAALMLTILNSAYADTSAAIRVINTSGGGKVNITVKNISDNNNASGGAITWSGAEAGVTAWKMADQYIEISKESLPLLWGMQIYTDNKNASADPEYAGTRDPAGLVKIGNTIMTLPMAWRITDHVLSGPELRDPIERTNTEANGFEDYLWHFMKDKNTTDDETTDNINEAFVNAQEYVTLWNQSGIAWNEGARSANPKKAYIYFAAKFTVSNVGAEYKTSMLTIEAFRGVSPFPIYLYKDASLTEFPNEPGATLDNHFAPSGWMNVKASNPHIEIDAKCKDVIPHSGMHCFKFTWNGKNGNDNGKWGGIMWLEPEDIWETGGVSATNDGYDLRGASYLRFWARTDSSDIGLQIKIYFGNTWDSCGKSSEIWAIPALNTNWQEYLLSLSGHDMSNVTGGLVVIFDKLHDPGNDGCNIYLDDIRFE